MFMTTVSYHASHEQFSPNELLHWACLAEQAGFDAVFSSDHVQPWSRTQGHSAFVWSWMGAALQATRHISFSTVTVPGGWRYQPVVLAQAIATLCEMYPGRVPSIALGSGEALNECLTGLDWPAKPQRDQRLRDGAHAIQNLLAGQRVRSGTLPAVRDARLWCRPARPPLLLAAASSVATARWVGGWADGMLTVAENLSTLRERVDAFRAGGGEGKPVHAKVDVCWAPTQAEALHQAHARWRFNGAGGDANVELRQPEDFEQATQHLTPQQTEMRVFVSADLEQHARYLEACAAIGLDSIDIHQVGVDQEGFIRGCAEVVLPMLRRAQQGPHRG